MKGSLVAAAIASFVPLLLAPPARGQACPAFTNSYTALPVAPSYTSIVGGPSTTTLFLPMADDGTSTAAAIGFPFSFFGLPKASFQVNANGWVGFDTALGGGYFVNPGLPSAAAPNDIACPWWDDLFHQVGSSTTVSAIVGAPGSQQLVVEWRDLESWPGNGSGENASFQLVVNEGTGVLEFHYDASTFVVGTDPYTATIGLESLLGLVSVDATGAGAGNALFPVDPVTSNPTDFFLVPAPAPPVTYFDYAITPAPLPFPSVIGAPGAVTLFAPPTNDAISPVTAIGFPFTFFGSSKAQFRVSSNGFVTFDPSLSGGVATNSVPGLPGLPGDYAAPFWDDLVHGSATALTAYVVSGPPGARTLAVEWRDLERIPLNASGENARFAAVFYEGTNDVSFHYDAATFVPGTTAPNIFSATIGLENANGSRGIDATGAGTNNSAFPSSDLLLDPCDCGVAVPFGAGCATAAGPVPAIGSSGGSPLSPNPAYAVTLANAPANAPVVLLIGGSNLSWLAAPLPLALGPFGIPGCSLLVSMDSTVSVAATAAGTASVPVGLPAGFLCLGAAYAQWLVVDLAVVGVPVRFSNGLEVHL